MRVVVKEFLISAQLVDCYTTTVALKEFYDGSIRSGEHWSSGRGWNVDGIMHSSFGARRIESINQLVGSNARDRNDQQTRIWGCYRGRWRWTCKRRTR